MNKERQKATINRTYSWSSVTPILRSRLKCWQQKQVFVIKYGKRAKTLGEKIISAECQSKFCISTFLVSYCMSYTLYNKNLIKQMSALFEDNWILKIEVLLKITANWTCHSHCILLARSGRICKITAVMYFKTFKNYVIVLSVTS